MLPAFFIFCRYFTIAAAAAGMGISGLRALCFYTKIFVVDCIFTFIVGKY